MMFLSVAIQIIHFFIVAFFVLAPFTNDVGAWALHAMLVPLLYLHWTLNDDTCALTVLECWVTGKEKHQSFVHSIVGPIYNVDPKYINTFTSIAPLLLWVISLLKLRQFLHAKNSDPSKENEL